MYQKQNLHTHTCFCDGKDTPEELIQEALKRGFDSLGFVPTLVTNATTFGMMRDMDKKGIVLNAAFAVSAAFVFGSHLGFTMGMGSAYVVPVVVGKLISGVAAVVLAMIVYKDK